MPSCSRGHPLLQSERLFLLEELERVNLQLECKLFMDHRDLVLREMTRLGDDEPFVFAQVFALTR